MTLIITTPYGGTTFAAHIQVPDDDTDGGIFLGTVEAGDLTHDGQWTGTDEDIEAAIMETFGEQIAAQIAEHGAPHFEHR